ncbi:kinase-like protein [Gigaspora margarita]|uniref:Kinase-like protein n=1 Tax=Gigaspora margarita TaxID=4874 RepID=A0A8H3X7Y6_GIGMA|nr:kinase-like protein [Gigaspora margarita]
MGDACGAFNVGYCYLNGIGVEHNKNKAFIHYLKSAEMDNVDGLLEVGYCYLNGIGVEKDEYKAFTYYQKSAEIELNKALK